MPSDAATHAIMFIASMVVAASVVGGTVTSADQLSDALRDRSLDIKQDFETEIVIMTTTGMPVHNRSGDGNITVLVKNTGDRRLQADSEAIDVILDGEYRSNISVIVVDGSEWEPNNVIRITFDPGSFDYGDHHITVAVGPASDGLGFKKE